MPHYTRRDQPKLVENSLMTNNKDVLPSSPVLEGVLLGPIFFHYFNDITAVQIYKG